MRILTQQTNGSIPEDMARCFTYLRTKAIMRDSSFLEGIRSRYMEPDYKTRLTIADVVSALECGILTANQIPNDVVDWFYGYTAFANRANKARLDAQFTADGERV